MVFQHYSLYPWLNVIDNIKFSRLLGANRQELSSADVEAASGRADALLRLIGLSKVASPIRTSSRAACSSAWRSPVRCSDGPRCC